MAGRTKHFDKKVFVPCCSVAPNKIAFYSVPIDGFSHHTAHNTWLDNFQDNQHGGFVSSNARKKIELSLSYLLLNAKQKKVFIEESQKTVSFKINFVTLTLPSQQVHSDEKIKKVCLNNFLSIARKSGLKNYIWRAEAQPISNNIHFHLTTDHFMHYSDIRRWWNKSVSLLGYIEEFKLLHGHTDPNSTDVHKVKHVRRLASYVSKYISKNKSFPCIGELRLIDGDVKEILYSSAQYKSETEGQKLGKVIGHMLGARIRPITGRLWGCSESLSKSKTLKFHGEKWKIDTFLEFATMCDFHKSSSQWCDVYYGDIGVEAEKWFPQLHKWLTNVTAIEQTV